MKRLLALVAALLALGALQPPASAGAPAALKSQGQIGIGGGSSRSGLIWYFQLSGTLHVGNKVWSGVAYGRHDESAPTEMGMWGTSPDGVLSTTRCVDGVHKADPGAGLIVCQASIDGSAPKPLVLAVTIDGYDSYSGYPFKGTYTGP